MNIAVDHGLLSAARRAWMLLPPGNMADQMARELPTQGMTVTANFHSMRA
jgi:hypothetical protein